MRHIFDSFGLYQKTGDKKSVKETKIREKKEMNKQNLFQ